jgi:hypothetical protein
MANEPRGSGEKAALAVVSSRLDKLDARVPDKLAERIAALEAIRDHKPHWMIPLLATLGISALVGYMGWIGISLVQIKNDVARIDSGLRPLGTRLTAAESQLTKQNIIAHTLMSQTDFSTTLSDLKSALVTAKHRGLPVPSAVINQLQQKLIATNQAAPDYWPTTALFISYRSMDTSAGRATSRLRDCTDSKPMPYRVTAVGPQGEMRGFSNPYYENCKFTIDSSGDDARLNAFIADGFPVIEFRRCLIVYRGGAFTLITHVKMKNAPLSATTGKGQGASLNIDSPSMIFTQCELDFSVPDQLLAQGQVALQALLQQTGASLSFPPITN